MDQMIFFTDMDDTLLDQEKRVSRENREAIEQALLRGHKIAFNTGRPLAGFLPMVRELGFEREGCYAIAFNGGLIYDCGAGKVIYRKGLPAEYVREIFQKTEEFGLYCHTYSDSSLLCKRAGTETEFYTRSVQIPVVEDPQLPAHMTEEPCKMLVIDLAGRERMDAYREAMAPWARGRVSMFYSNPWYLEHVPEHVSKGEAIRVLCELCGIPLERTVAAGDEENDIPMLRTAHVGAAMANATDAVKKCADYISDQDCNHSGVAEILHKFVLHNL